MNRCVLAMLLAVGLVSGCARSRCELPRPQVLRWPRLLPKRYSLSSPAPLSSASSPFQQYTAADFDWTSVQRILILPFGNRSPDARIPEQVRTALTAELQQAGRFEIVVAPLDEPATGAKEVFDRGQFDEAEILQLSRRFQVQGILYGLVTDYRSYAPPMLGISLLLISPGEAVVVASVDGLWDARDQTTVALAADYYHSTQTFPLSLLGSDRVIESPDIFRRFVCRQVAQSLATVPAPTVPPGKRDRDASPLEPGSPAPALSAASGKQTGRRPQPTGPAASSRPKPDAAGLPVRQAANIAPAAELAETRVTHIVLNPRLTGGYNFDSHPGDDGIRLTLEPRNADGRFVPQTRALSIIVSDPAEEGWAARWDLEPAQLEALVPAADVLGQGFHLKLLWSGEPPRHAELLLRAQYLDNDGRTLETDQKILVDLPPRTAWGASPVAARGIALPGPLPPPGRGPAAGAGVATRTGQEIESPAPQFGPKLLPPSSLPPPAPSPAPNAPQAFRDAVFQPHPAGDAFPHPTSTAFPAGFERQVTPPGHGEASRSSITIRPPEKSAGLSLPELPQSKPSNAPREPAPEAALRGETTTGHDREPVPFDLIPRSPLHGVPIDPQTLRNPRFPSTGRPSEFPTTPQTLGVVPAGYERDLGQPPRDDRPGPAAPLRQPSEKSFALPVQAPAPVLRPAVPPTGSPPSNGVAQPPRGDKPTSTISIRCVENSQKPPNAPKAPPDQTKPIRIIRLSGENTEAPTEPKDQWKPASAPETKSSEKAQD
jgi:hypothetical protein